MCVTKMTTDVLRFILNAVEFNVPLVMSGDVYCRYILRAVVLNRLLSKIPQGQQVFTLCCTYKDFVLSALVNKTQLAGACVDRVHCNSPIKGKCFKQISNSTPIVCMDQQTALGVRALRALCMRND